MRTTSILTLLKQTTRFFLLTALLSCFLFNKGFSQALDMNQETQKLISRLNLNTPGLATAARTADDPGKFSQELLKYYRARTSVKHHVSREARQTALGNSASEGDFVAAENALKHIFVGQSAYPPYFCGEDIDWGTRPVPDNEWVWQLNRMGFWGALARVYWHTGDEKYAQAWVYQMMDWYRKNPNDEAHRHAWRSIEAGIRGNSWTGLYQRFVDSPSFTPDALVVFLNSLYDHASFLMTKYTTRSNWGLMEAEGMAFIAFTFPEFKDALTWRTEAIRRLNNEISIQVYPDGHQRELAMGYHTGCIGWFSRTYELAKMNGIEDAFPQSYLDMIEKMCEVPLKLCHPDGTIAQFGDSWAGRPGQHNRRYQEWAELYDREDFLYLATDGKEGKQPDSTAYALPYSGLYSLRSSWDKDAICLVMKCGPDGGGHSQPDNGTFELSAGGRTLMPDAGSYIYSGDPENRAWFRQTKVHQTLTLDGKNSVYAPKLLLWQPGENLDLVVVENDSYPGLTHRRAIFFVDKKYFVIVDEAYGDATGEVNLHFQFGPGDAVLDNGTFTARTDFRDGWNVLVKTNDQKGLSMLEEEGQVSFIYTKKEPRPAFCYRVNKGKPEQGIRYITVVAPYDSDIPDIRVQEQGQAAIGGDRISLLVNARGTQKNLGYTLKL